MDLCCIALPRPGPRLRVVIIIVLYLAAFRIFPADVIPMAAGAILGLVTVGSADPGRAGGAPGRGR